MPEHETSIELIGRDIHDKLAELRTALSTRLLLEGLAWVALALVTLVFVTMAMDYALRLERPLRAAVMALAAGGVLVVAWKRLVVPARVPMGLDELALLVERRFGQLDDRLIAAIQLGRLARAEAVGMSAAMVSRMAQQARDLAAPLPFRDVVERRGLKRSWSVAGCALALLLGFGFWQGDILGRWFQRNVLFADIPWPQETYLAVASDPPNFTVLRGDDLKVIVEVADRSRSVPSHVTLHGQYPTIGHTEERIEPDRDNPRRFVKVFPAVAEEFELYVVGGDDRRDARDPHRVRLIEPPLLRDVVFTVRTPPHMNRPAPLRYEAGSGALGVPVGSTVTVEAVANKPLRRGEILLDDAPAGTLRARQASREGSGGAPPKRYVGTFEVGASRKASAKDLRFVLTDTEGHTNRRGAKYLVEVQPDHRPTVEASKERIGSRISPMAVVPLMLKVRDDHGIAGAEIVLRHGEGDANAVPRGVNLPPDTGGQLDRVEELDIEPLNLPPGSTVYVAARATDTLPDGLGGPNVGESGSLTFRIVKAEDLLAEFVRRQKEIRLEFVEAVALQETARAKSDAAVRAVRGNRVPAEARGLLRSSAAVQTSVGAEVAKAADRLGAIVEEMKNNRVGTETGREQIRRGIVQPLRRLRAPITKITGALHGTESVEDAAELQGQARDVVEIQGDVLAEMNAILDRMVKLENKQELANKLQLIIRWSEQLLDTIKEKEEAEVGDVFEDATTQPAESKP